MICVEIMLTLQYVSIAIVVTLHLSLHMYAGHIHILLVLCLLRIHRHVFRVTYWTIALHIYHGYHVHTVYSINITCYIESARLTIHYTCIERHISQSM